MTEPETAECWVLQQRIRPSLNVPWQPRQWAVRRDYLSEETAVAACDRIREQVKQQGWEGREEWRVLHVTQEVVY